MPTFDRPLDFRTAVVALSALFKNPDDTKQAFRVVHALGGPSGERMYQKFRATEVGKRILAERRVLLAHLSDEKTLEALPDGTLGRAYLDFLRSQQITADGLVSASEEGYGERVFDDERQLFSDRLRDMHDLWHVVAGYRGDLIGEASVLGLSYVQTKNPGVGLISALGFLKFGPLGPEARSTIIRSFGRARRAAWLPAVDWEAMLLRPLGEVRRELGFTTTPTYQPVYSSDPRVQAALAS